MTMMFVQLFIGCIMIGMTVIIHALALDRTVWVLEYASPVFYRLFYRFWKTPLMIIRGVFQNR